MSVKVLSIVDNIANGGAGRAAYRIHQGVNAVDAGVQSKMFVKVGQQQEDVATLDQFVPHNALFRAFDWIAGKVKNQIQHKIVWRPYKKTQDSSYKSDLRGTWLNGALMKQEYDVLHLHWINKRFIKIEDLPTDKPIVWSLHDTWPFCGVCHYFGECDKFQHICGACPSLGSTIENDLSRKVLSRKKEVYDKLDLHIVAPSNWMAECARKSSLFAGRDIRVIPNCLDTELFKPLDIQPDKTYILYGAANAAKDERKGFKYLLRALEVLNEQGFTDYEVLVFGANKGDIELPVGVPVQFLGFISDPRQLVILYNQAAVMVVPSHNENLSCAIMEALSCGRPVCCFDIGGNSDMVEHRVNGYLAKEKDCADMAAGIQECIAHSAEWGKSARESVLQKYTTEIVAKQYVELYREVTK